MEKGALGIIVVPSAKEPVSQQGVWSAAIIIHLHCGVEVEHDVNAYNRSIASTNHQQASVFGICVRDLEIRRPIRHYSTPELCKSRSTRIRQ